MSAIDWKLVEIERIWKKVKETCDEIAKATRTRIRIRAITWPRQDEKSTTRQEELRVDNVLNINSGEWMNE